jgi:hypothetical protein
LSKTDNNYVIRGCTPATYYDISLWYSAYYQTGGIVGDAPENKMVDSVRVQTSSNLGNIEVVKQTENAIEFDVTLDNQYLIEAGKVALYTADGTLISHVVLDRSTIESAAKNPVRLNIPLGSTAVANGDRLYLQFIDVVFNGAAFTIPNQASFTYTK